MATRLHIQKEVFSPADERLIGLVNVTKPGRRKRASFLCASVNLTEKPPLVFVSRIKTKDRSERGGAGGGYYREKQWRFSELRRVDGKSVEGQVPEFELHFDKTVHKWIASSVPEKKAFISILYKMSHKYLDRKKPVFVNADEEKLEDGMHVVDLSKSADRPEDAQEAAQDDYQELTEQEERDLETLVSQRENAIQDAAVFTENLSEELAQLDDANIHTLMGSEKQIQELMGNLDQALYEIEKMETKLSVYDELLSQVRQTMGTMGQQYSRILIENTNLSALHEEVFELVGKLDLDPRVEKILTDYPISGATNIRDCTQAAHTLRGAIGQELSQGVQILQAVTERKRFFSTLSFKFSQRMMNTLRTAFEEKSVHMLENLQVRHGTMPTISSHNSVHADLLLYRELMLWAKECEPNTFTEIVEGYSVSFKAVYDEEIKGFMLEMKGMMGRGSEVKRGGILGKGTSSADFTSSLSISKHNPISRSLMALSPGSRERQFTSSVADFSSPPGAGFSPLEVHNRAKFAEVFGLLLDQLQPVCISEQKFCITFFHFEKPESVEPDLGTETEEGFDQADSRRQLVPLQHIAVGAMARGLPTVLGSLFKILLAEIEALITFGEKQDHYNALFLTVTINHRLATAVDSGTPLSYLDETLKKVLVCVKRFYDSLIASKKRQIEEMKTPKGSRCGILPCVLVFNEFAERAESIVVSVGRRVELDRAYVPLMESLFRTVERAAREHTKTPPDVIKFENYKRIYDILSRHKIACLEASRDEAKKKRRAHMKQYVGSSLGRPLEKLSLFFEGVENLIASGTKADEVGFRLDYSRNELRKCIKEYPGKEVKRGLEKLYRRLEKEVSDEEQQVVWGAMQEAFMEQFLHFQQLTDRCYPGANLAMDFDLQSLTDYFVGISQQRSAR